MSSDSLVEWKMIVIVYSYLTFEVFIVSPSVVVVVLQKASVVIVSVRKTPRYEHF